MRAVILRIVEKLWSKLGPGSTAKDSKKIGQQSGGSSVLSVLPCASGMGEYTSGCLRGKFSQKMGSSQSTGGSELFVTGKRGCSRATLLGESGHACEKMKPLEL